MQANNYARGQYVPTEPSGSAVETCITGHFQRYDIGGDNVIILSGVMFGSGMLFAITLILLGYVLALKWNLKDMVELSYTYSYRHYGVWWGVTCFKTMAIFTIHLFYIVHLIAEFFESIHSYGLGQSLAGTVLAITVIPGIPIATYFTCKTKPPAVPCIILIPVTVLCCCNKRHAEVFVLGIAMWVNIMGDILGIIHGLCILVAILAEPFAVITNTLALFLGVFCVINILALLFTISAHIFTPKHLRPQGQGKTMLRAVLLIPLLAMITCFCISIGSLGYLINQNTRQGNALSLLSSSIFPIVIGATTFGLKKLITKWLESPPNTQERKDDYTVLEQATLLP